MNESLDQAGVLARLHDALVVAGTTHVFVGALPVLAWGRPRGTTDFDLVVFCGLPDLERLTAALAARGIDRKSDFPSSDPADPLPDMVIFWTSETPSVRVDVFVAKVEFERAVLATAREATIFGTRLLVASAEASIIYKLIAHRPKDVGDVDALFEAREAAGAGLDWAFLDRWATEWEIDDRLAPYRARYRSP